MEDERRRRKGRSPLLSRVILHPSDLCLPKERGERMHRTTPGVWSLLGALLALLAGGVVAPSRVAAQTCTPPPRQIVVLINGTERLQLSTKKRIRAVTNPKEGI